LIVDCRLQRVPAQSEINNRQSTISLLMANDREKEAAARASLRFVKDGQVVGLGTGSTAVHFIRLLGEQVKNGLRIRGIPSSERSRDQAASLGIPLTTLDECPEIDVTVDGADEVDPQLRLIKGGGGALLREKIVASATKLYVIIVDETKQVPVLGRFPLPVEVIKFARAVVEKKLWLWAQRSVCDAPMTARRT
jgi:ribose 5-phosphate isomerase A